MNATKRMSVEANAEWLLRSLETIDPMERSVVANKVRSKAEKVEEEVNLDAGAALAKAIKLRWGGRDHELGIVACVGASNVSALKKNGFGINSPPAKRLCWALGLSLKDLAKGQIKDADASEIERYKLLVDRERQRLEDLRFIPGSP